MEITGKIKFIDETKTYGNNGFQKRELIITTDDDYPHTNLYRVYTRQMHIA